MENIIFHGANVSVIFYIWEVKCDSDDFVSFFECHSVNLTFIVGTPSNVSNSYEISSFYIIVERSPFREKKNIDSVWFEYLLFQFTSRCFSIIKMTHTSSMLEQIEVKLVGMRQRKESSRKISAWISTLHLTHSIHFHLWKRKEPTKVWHPM